MANPLFNQLGGGNNMFQMLGQLKQNPLSLLQRAGYNIPANINDPKAMVQHLVNSGQVNQNQLNYAQQMAQMFGRLK